MRERVGAWGRRPCAGSAGRGESVGSPAPAEAAENAELGVAVAEREGRGAEAARGGTRSSAVGFSAAERRSADLERGMRIQWQESRSRNRTDLLSHEDDAAQSRCHGEEEKQCRRQSCPWTARVPLPVLMHVRSCVRAPAAHATADCARQYHRRGCRVRARGMRSRRHVWELLLLRIRDHVAAYHGTLERILAQVLF